MKAADRYAKIVQWSDQDQCYVGSVPDLTFGGCHGDDPRKVFDELCQIVEEIVALYETEARPLPEPQDALDAWRSAEKKRVAATVVP